MPKEEGGGPTMMKAGSGGGGGAMRRDRGLRGLVDERVIAMATCISA